MAKGNSGNCFPLFSLYWGMKRLITIILLAACKGEDPKPSYNLVPEELYERPLDEFYVEAEERGRTLTRIEPEVRFVDGLHIACDQGAKESNSFKEGDKYIIEITDEYAVYENDHNFFPLIFREMAHLVLSKPYATVPRVTDQEPAFDNIMYPCYNDSNGLSDQQLDHLFQ